MPEEVGGAGLDTVTWVLFEKELGRANYALHYTGVARPSNILLAGTEAAGALPAPLRARRATDCLAMTEPGAGSDMRACAPAPSATATAGGSAAPSTSSATPTSRTS